MMTPIPNQKYRAVEDWLLQSLDFETQLVIRIEQFLDSGITDTAYPGYCEQLFGLMAQHYTDSKAASYLESLDDLGELARLLDEFRTTSVAPQAVGRFYSLQGDSVWLRLSKLAKRAALKLGWFGLRTANLFRKSKVQPEFWAHQVEESALAAYVFVDCFSERLLVFAQDLFFRREERIRQLYNMDRALEQLVLQGVGTSDFRLQLSELKGGLDDDKLAIQRFIAEAEPELDSLFAELYEKAGTIEFPNKRLRSRSTMRRKKRTLAQLDADLQHTQWVFFGVAEYWRLKLDNRNLIFKLNSQAGAQQGEIQLQISEKLRPAFIQLKKTLAEFASTKPAAWDEPDNVLAIRKFAEFAIPELVQLVFKTRLPALFEQPMLELEQAIKRGPELHRFSVHVFDAKQLSENAFQTLKTKELLSGIILKSLRGQFAAERTKFEQQVQRLARALDEIKLAANYSVDFFFEHQNEEAALAELNAGIKRTVKKADEMLSNLADIQKLATDTFSLLSESFTSQVLLYFEPKNLHQSVKINKRRTRNEQLREDFRELTVLVRKYRIRYWITLKTFWQKANNRYFNLRSLLGISYEKAPISTELSNYLSETKQAIGRLPLMYQKLFENTPLNDERFYLPRRTDLVHLDEAFASWKNGNFAPTCVVAEQGSGTTTLFNFFVKSLDSGYRVMRLELRDNITEEPELLSFFSEAFPDLRVSSFDELIDALNQLPEPQIIIFENIHNLFLRINGAYGNLYRLFKLISQTNKKVFWLTSCFEYSWTLLNYSFDIAGYFAHVVSFSPLTAGDLRDAILKRHQVSGFSLNFLEPEGFSPKRAYQKLDEEGKQAYLSEVFFEEQWLYARSNIKLAFIFWLRAICKVDDGVIYLQQKQLNFGFLNSLKTNEITTLHSILVHGGLRQFEHGRVFRWDEADSARVLMVLTDDGLLEKEGETYVVNPLVYRMLVSQLKSLNFIY